MKRLVAALLILGAAGPAFARSDRDFPFGFSQVWPALVRFLRVDEHLKVIEKDESAGYVLFELTEEKRTFSGAAEMTHGADGTTKVIIRIQDRPSYMEEGLLDRLGNKLHEELGDPPPAPSPPPPPPPTGTPTISPKG